jgi:integrase/recombinase XerD
VERTVELPVEAEAFLTHLSVERGRSEQTIKAYRSDLRRYATFLTAAGPSLREGGRSDSGAPGSSVDVLSAEPADLEAYSLHLRGSSLAASTVTRMLVSVRGLYRYLDAEGVMPADPSTSLELPGQLDSLPKALPVHEVAAILDTVDAKAAGGDVLAMRDSALLEFLYGTGARVSEACGLGFGELDIDAGLARVLGKRDKERMVPLGRPAIDALSRWLDDARPAMLSQRAGRSDRDAVFLGSRGRRLSRQAAWSAIRLRAGEAGVPGDISPHVMRHSCATHMLEGGADIRTVAELLGHASVSTTQRYTRVATDKLFDSYRSAHPRAGGTRRAEGSGVLR